MSNFPKQLINEHRIKSMQVPGIVLGLPGYTYGPDQAPALGVLGLSGIVQQPFYEHLLCAGHCVSQQCIIYCQ